ncbi:MAG: hypothetical protein H6Q33_1616, partial [Deltaproteobacteria bacterium]|nr:hypothetical protein [Deltaproteobacteria bacterium]
MVGAERELLALIRAAPQDQAGFREACGRVTDWDKLVDCAIEQGVAGVVHTEAGKAGVVIPADAARKLEWRLAIDGLHWQGMRRSMSEVLQTLEAGGIRAVCLKGPMLAERLYEDASLRPSVDLDILVAEEDCERVISVLGAAGWGWDDGPSERYHRRYHHHVHLHRPRGPMLEVHFRALVGFGIVIPSEDFLSRAMPYQSGGDSTWILCPEDEVLYLALHAAGHLLSRLGWLYDIKLLLLKYPQVDWIEVSKRAVRLGVQ